MVSPAVVVAIISFVLLCACVMVISVLSRHMPKLAAFLFLLGCVLAILGFLAISVAAGYTLEQIFANPFTPR